MSNDWTTVDTSNPNNMEDKVEYEIETEEEPQDVTQEATQQNANMASTREHVEEQTTSAEDKSSNEVEEPQSGAQKRIRQLVRQKKERDEQIQELMARQQELEERLKSQQQEIKSSLAKNFEAAEAQINSRIELAKDSYKQALESGDTDRIVQAQENLSKAQSDATTLQVTRNQMPVEEETVQQEAPQQQPQQPQAQYDKLALEWAGRNSWFGQDNVMTSLALEIDQELKTEGYDPSEEDFYEEIDSRLRAKYPQRFGVEEEQRQQETSTPAQVVGGASRTSSASSGKKVRLTKEDVRLAEKWGVSLEQYAAEKLKVEQADGEYTSVY